MREQLEMMRDNIVGQIVDFDKGAALIAHDGITELIDAVEANTHQMLPKVISVATFAQVRKAIAEALNVAATKGSPVNYTLTDAARTGRKLSSRKVTRKKRKETPAKFRKRVLARKRQSRRA